MITETFPGGRPKISASSSRTLKMPWVEHHAVRELVLRIPAHQDAVGLERAVGLHLRRVAGLVHDRGLLQRLGPASPRWLGGLGRTLPSALATAPRRARRPRCDARHRALVHRRRTARRGSDRVSTTNGSGSYSTSTSASASRASSMRSAATAATSWPAKSSRSPASASDSTALTPGRRLGAARARASPSRTAAGSAAPRRGACRAARRRRCRPPCRETLRWPSTPRGRLADQLELGVRVPGRGSPSGTSTSISVVANREADA